MFTDIVNSTSLVEVIGDEAWANLLGWHDQGLRKLFQAHNGEEVKHVGDGFFVAFDQPREAVECAVEIQQHLAEHRKTAGFAPQVRIGLHTVEATQKRDDYEGRGVHEAARVGALAGPSEIIASRQTIEAAKTRFPTSEFRSVQVKGVSDPIEIASIESTG
jgi:class 3 adenylate cyclase